WDTSRSAAGSSGGAAVALATGTAWLAHGSDMGGSLRNPASFCGIVGLRPSIGRVAHTPKAAIDRNLGVQGPMARNVEDLAVLRAFDFALSKAALLRTKRDLLKPEVIWNIEEGLKLTVEQLERAEAQRVAMTARTLEFFDKYDLLLAPATIVPPFPVENRYVA